MDNKLDQIIRVFPHPMVVRNRFTLSGKKGVLFLAFLIITLRESECIIVHKV